MSALADRVLELVDEVHDPCSVSQGLATGLRSMGMVRSLELAEADDGQTVVQLTMRLTGPGCLYVVHFERELRDRIEALPGVARLDLVWDDEFDWSPDDMAEDVKARLRERRERILAEARERAGNREGRAPVEAP